MYGFDENRMKSIPLTELFDGPLPGSQLSTLAADAACASAAALLSQTIPVFGTLQGIAFHRDVCTHNILIRNVGPGHAKLGSAPATTLQFSILDFGLAVRSPNWSADYRKKNIAGDPRYFSPAAWMLIVYGQKYLADHPDCSFLRQYMARIDHFAIGIVSLEMIFTLSMPPPQDAAWAKSEVDSFNMVREAWRAYWADSVGLYQRFHAEGGAKLRQALKSSGAVSMLVEKLHTLCVALRNAGARIIDRRVASVFQVVADFIDPRGTLSWLDAQGRLEDKSILLHTSRSSAIVLESDTSTAASDEHSQEPAASPKMGQINATVHTPPRPRPAQRHSFGHRRVWTVDGAKSLTKSLTQMSFVQEAAQPPALELP